MEEAAFQRKSKIVVDENVIDVEAVSVGAEVLNKGAVSSNIFDPTSIVEEMISGKDKIEGIFVPDDDTISLLEVGDWIPMPEDLQEVMACQGIPCGHVIEVIGKKDSGKTTFATQSLAEAQRSGGIACLLDTERKFSIKRAANMGVDVKKLIIIQAKTLEAAFEKFERLIDTVKSKKEYRERKLLVVWDSLGQTPSEAELDPKVTDFSMTAAKIIKGGLRKIRTKISDEKTAFLIINQVYANMNSFGKQTTPYGGSGPEYAASIIMEFVKKGGVRPKGLKSPAPWAGAKIEVECIKNHIGQPFRKKEFFIDWRGFVTEKEVDYAPDEKIKMEGEK